MKKKKRLGLNEMKKAVYNTQFEIKTCGKDAVLIKANGCQAGIIYKLALTISELMQMDCMDIQDLPEVCELATEHYLANKNQRKKEEPTCRIAEIRGDLADELYNLLKQVERGEIDKEDIDFEDFMRRAQEESEDD